MTDGIKETRQPDRWLTTWLNGKVLHQQLVQPDCMVIRVSDLPALFMDPALVPDDVAKEVANALSYRLVA